MEMGVLTVKMRTFFLNKISASYPDLVIEKLEVYYNKQNQEVMESEAKRLGVAVRGVPFIIIGDQYVIGYQSDETTGYQLQTMIQQELEKTQQKTESMPESNSSKVLPDILTLPIIGQVKTSTLSLPIFTIVVAAIDGFNPCAMWTLLFLISLLLGMKDRRRMWLLGLVFVITSAVVYFLFLSGWLQLFIFFGYLRWLQIGIGGVALIAGGYYLWDFWVNRDGSCRITQSKNRQKVFLKLKELTHKKQLFIAVLGIMVLAIAVNLVEVVCSAGLPAIYTQVISLSKLSWWQYYAYIFLYIIVFMLDDMFIFFTAMLTLRAVGIEGKYARISHCVGGILLLVIGILLVIKPELLK